MAQIGFTHPTPPQKPSRGPIDPLHILLRFDSGKLISFMDALCHLLILGTTGAGKTQSAVLPMLWRLIQAGYCGLVADLKGNLRAGARALARQCGRLKDVFEIGSSSSATPLNLLCGMTMHVVREFLTTLTLRNLQGNFHNADWHLKGINQACDCVQLLRYLTVLNPAFEPTLVMIAEMLNDLELCARLFKLFKESPAYDKNDAQQRRFVRGIESNAFHVFKYDAKKSEGDHSSDFMSQVTWNLQGIRMALRSFLDAPGVSRGFATQGAPGLDMRELLKQGKIVLLRFGPETGPVGASLARMVLETYYEAVYAIGLTLDEGRYTFAVLDEYQDMADLSTNRLSDASFIAQAREFRSAFIAATQSLAALNRGNSMAAVDSFVSNCNNRIIFYSDDPHTQEMASHCDPNVRLNDLQPGQAFVIRYEADSHTHASGMETLQRAYDDTRKILKQQGDADKGGPHDR